MRASHEPVPMLKGNSRLWVREQGAWPAKTAAASSSQSAVAIGCRMLNGRITAVLIPPDRIVETTAEEAFPFCSRRQARG
jgi:hypothetical protein